MRCTQATTTTAVGSEVVSAGQTKRIVTLSKDSTRFLGPFWRRLLNITYATEITRCEVCGGIELESVLDLGKHPLCDDLVPEGDSRICIEHPIEILFCSNCATAHQRFQIPKQELFPPTYHYRSRFTSDVVRGMAALADACETRIGSLRGIRVLDIGCNDGSLLDCFRERGAITAGIEPTDAWRDALGRGHEISHGFFSPDAARDLRTTWGIPDIVTFTNVFAHIENLPMVLEALRSLLAPQTMLVIENHYLGSVLDRHQFDTFYHEHPRTYSLTSFEHIARSLGLPVTAVEFPSRYGGNIRVFIGGDRNWQGGAASQVQSVLDGEQHFPKRLREMQFAVERWRTAMAGRIHRLSAEHGRLSAKAFPARAAILVKLLGLDVSVLEAVYEKPGSMKIGHYVPGTRIPIRSDELLFASLAQPRVILNLAWHISSEIRAYLAQQGYAGDVVDIIDPDSFAS